MVYFPKADGAYPEYVKFLQIHIYKFYKTYQHLRFNCYASDEDKHIISSIPCGQRVLTYYLLCAIFHISISTGSHSFNPFEVECALQQQRQTNGHTSIEQHHRHSNLNKKRAREINKHHIKTKNPPEKFREDVFTFGSRQTDAILCDSQL